MKTFWKIMDTLMDTLLAILLFAIAVICIAEILSRTLIGPSIMWSNEASRYLFVYVVFVGAAVLTRDDDFIRMDLIQAKIPGKVRYYYDMVLQLLIICYAIVMLKNGYAFALKNGIQRSSAMHIPMNYLYMIMPVSGFMIILYALRNIVRETRKNFGKGGHEA